MYGTYNDELEPQGGGGHSGRFDGLGQNAASNDFGAQRR
jgi:hypothetical protein